MYAGKTTDKLNATDAYGRRSVIRMSPVLTHQEGQGAKLKRQVTLQTDFGNFDGPPCDDESESLSHIFRAIDARTAGILLILIAVVLVVLSCLP